MFIFSASAQNVLDC